MIEGGEGSALDIFHTGQAEEQECLFYVALSRARDRLVLYAPTQKANGYNRPVSPFLDRLGSCLRRRSVAPSRLLPTSPKAGDITLAIEGGLSFDAPQIALYESCPRRFFYTHVLQVGGRRSTTAFMLLHEAVRSVVAGLIGEQGPMTEEELARRATAALAEQGLADHGYHGEFRTLALTMLRFFAASRNGHTPESPVAINLRFDEEQIVVRPDEVLVRPDGGHTLRRIRTGHLRSTESKDVGAAAFVLAARQAFPDAVVELVHLSDFAARPLVLSATELQNRRGKLAGFLQAIRRGRFPAEVSSRTCPGCPAFFICGPTPAGPLPKNLD